MFVDGTDFERVYSTGSGPIGVLAEVEIQNKILILRDLLIYPTETDRALAVGVRSMLEILRSIEREAAVQGFDECRVTAKRLSGASPGRTIERTRRLR